MDQVEGVDNLTACDSVMLKGSHGRAYLSLNCCKRKTKKWKKTKQKNECLV